MSELLDPSIFQLGMGLFAFVFIPLLVLLWTAFAAFVGLYASYLIAVPLVFIVGTFKKVFLNSPSGFGDIYETCRIVCWITIIVIVFFFSWFGASYFVLEKQSIHLAIKLGFFAFGLTTLFIVLLVLIGRAIYGWIKWMEN